MRSYKIIGLGMLGSFLGMVLFTGISWFYQDVFTVDRSGTIDLRVSNTGNVGIGMQGAVDSPGSRLVVKASGTGTTTSALDVQASDGASRLLVRDDGNVGIGTIGPSSLLHILSSGNAFVRLESGTGLASSIYQYNGATAGGGIVMFPASDTRVLSIVKSDLVNGNAPLTVLQSGNVGIGTASPATSAKLEIAGTDGALLIPRLTTAQRDALTAANGMVIYNTTTNAFNFRENGAWVTK